MNKALIIIADILDEDTCYDYLLVNKKDTKNIAREINNLSAMWYDLEPEESYDKYENQFNYIIQKIKEKYRDVELLKPIQVNI